MPIQNRSLWDRFWRDRRGQVVIWQMPNVFLIGWVVLTFISLMLTGQVSDIFSWIGTVFIVIWAFLEMFKGVNYFRRTFGAIVLLLIILTIIHIV